MTGVTRTAARSPILSPQPSRKVASLSGCAVSSAPRVGLSFGRAFSQEPGREHSVERTTCSQEGLPSAPLRRVLHLRSCALLTEATSAPSSGAPHGMRQSASVPSLESEREARQLWGCSSGFRANRELRPAAREVERPPRPTFPRGVARHSRPRSANGQRRGGGSAQKRAQQCPSQKVAIRATSRSASADCAEDVAAPVCGISHLDSAWVLLPPTRRQDTPRLGHLDKIEPRKGGCVQRRPQSAQICMRPLARGW